MSYLFTFLIVSLFLKDYSGSYVADGLLAGQERWPRDEFETIVVIQARDDYGLNGRQGSGFKLLMPAQSRQY